jgi:hypothetical protein
MSANFEKVWRMAPLLGQKVLKTIVLWNIPAQYLFEIRNLFEDGPAMTGNGVPVITKLVKPIVMGKGPVLTG